MGRTNHVLPKFLYRFRAIRNRKEIIDEINAIKNNYVWTSSFDQLNDPMEGMYELIEPDSDYMRINNLDRDTIIKIVKRGKGICSFTETLTNNLMWSHYANIFKGIAIEYDFHKLVRSSSNDTIISKVTYEDDVMKFSAFQSEIDVDSILSVKNWRWSYEREWRIISVGQGQQIFNVNPVAAIYVGTQITEYARRSFNKIAREKGISMKRIAIRNYNIFAIE